MLFLVVCGILGLAVTHVLILLLIFRLLGIRSRLDDRLRQHNTHSLRVLFVPWQLRNEIGKVSLIARRQRPHVLRNRALQLQYLVKLYADLLCDRALLREHRPNAIQYLERALGLGWVLVQLRVLQDDLEELREARVNVLHNFLAVVLLRHDFRLVHEAAETRVGLALGAPHKTVWISPPVDHLEPLHEEHAKVLRLVARATVDRQDDPSHDLGEHVEYVDLGHAAVDQSLHKLNAEDSVARREHQSRIQAVLNEELGHAQLVLDLLKHIRQIVLEPFLGAVESDRLYLLELMLEIVSLRLCFVDALFVSGVLALTILSSAPASLTFFQLYLGFVLLARYI